MRYRLVFVTLLLSAGIVAQERPFDSRAGALAQGTPELPRFRAGANLVRVDAYVSKEDVAVTDLTAADFEVFEDDKPQTIEHFEAITARAPAPQSSRTDPANVRDMNQQAADAARVFTLFFDRWQVSLAGSYRARKPIIETLDRVIGPDALIGVMTPEMSPSAVTYSRRTGSIERAVTDTWHWGARDQIMTTPQEDSIRACYSSRDTADLAGKMIARLREKQTLDALDALISHLEVLRPERKFVLVFTEGWTLFRADPSMDRVADGRTPSQDAPRTNPATGGLAKQGDEDPRTGRMMTLEACDRLRTLLAYSDHETEFRQMLQRANRANISFYPIDARGLIVFDTPIEWGVPPAVDRAWLESRYDGLRMMAAQTDGQAVLGTSNDVSGAMSKLFRDVGSYYLLSYYSTNPKLDGRFRRIRVDVKGREVDVRARPGYLAPTEAEARAAGAAITRAGAKPAPPLTVTRALDAIAPARGNLPVRVQAAGGRNTILTVVELDTATLKQPEWVSGGTLRLTFEPERTGGASRAPAGQSLTVPIDAGQRSIVIAGPEQPLAAGRYSIRAEMTARNSRTPIQVTTFATVPADAAEVGSGGLAARRGPSTGLAYIATADPRFRRTERLRLEVPLASEGFAGDGRVLTREGQAMPLIVTVSTRTDETTRQLFGVADVTLAPLAAGEYVLELSLTKAGKTETVAYGFRIVP
jgi:VWFA-related protein